MLRPALAAGVVVLLAAIAGVAWWQPWTSGVHHADLEPSAALTQHAASIVVLPFDNMGGGEEMDYFSNGMTEEIIAEPSLYPSLTVISRTSTFTYKGKSVTAAPIAGAQGRNNGVGTRFCDRVKLGGGGI